MNQKKKILLTGSNGMLASSIINKLKIDNKFEIFGFNSEELDIKNEKVLEDKINLIRPEIFINCAGYTKVDLAEDNPFALEVNGEALKYISALCAEKNIYLIHFSTDYIFSSNEEKEFMETDLPNPINTYGKSKLIGENYVLKQRNLRFFLARIQWLYGKNGPNFVDKILELSREKKELKIVNDQIGKPTSTDFVSEIIAQVIENEIEGVYHVAPKNKCSWFDFAKYFLKKKGITTKLVPVSSEEYPTRAKRPKYSVLNSNKLEKAFPYFPIPTWEELIDEYLGD